MANNVVSSNTSSVGFFCERLPTGSGYTWTLTTRLGELLEEAEERFGPRDREWTPLGIEFGGEVPRTWYPGDCKHVSIKLTASAADDPQRAIFQLAHEVIHLLSPGPREQNLLVEEGVATLFSLEVSARFDVHLRYADRAYDHAAERVGELLKIAPDAVKRLRSKRPTFSDFTPGFIHEVLPKVTERLAADLCEPFAVVVARFGLGN